MRGERIIVSVLVLAFGLCYANSYVPIHSSQLESLNDEVKDKVYEQAYFKLKSVSAQLEAKNKACNVKTEHFSQLCERTNCENSKIIIKALKKVINFAKQIEKKLKKLVGYERLKKAWGKVKKAWKKLEKPFRKIGKAARKFIRKVGRGISRVVRRAARNLRRAVRRVTDKISRVVRRTVRRVKDKIRRVVRRVKDKIRRVVRVRVRLPRIRYPRIRFRFRRWGKKRSIAERRICAFCKRLGNAKDNVATLLSLVCGSSFQQEESRLMNQVNELERLMSSLENENKKVKFVMKVEYDPKSIFFPSGQLSFSKVYVTLNAKSHIWTFRSPNPLTIVPFQPSKLTAPISNKILRRYGVK